MTVFLTDVMRQQPSGKGPRATFRDQTIGVSLPRDNLLSHGRNALTCTVFLLSPFGHMAGGDYSAALYPPIHRERGQP
jgi:hypothetical protein